MSSQEQVVHPAWLRSTPWFKAAVVVLGLANPQGITPGGWWESQGCNWSGDSQNPFNRRMSWIVVAR